MLAFPGSRAVAVFFFNDTATTEIYTLSLHDALPISLSGGGRRRQRHQPDDRGWHGPRRHIARSEEHTSELQSPCNLVCRLLLEKKKEYEHPYVTYANENIATVWWLLNRLHDQAPLYR